MKRLADSLDPLPVLTEVQPGDRTLVLEGDLEAEDLGVETDRPIEIRDIEVHVGNTDWLNHLLTPAGERE